ncbi:hypothetical protein [Streptomyces sp. NPDC056453]|uniref:hypothetical protein n=1 Tax=Streptomyces sp. NPDC056453 TaxID=3345822 RepID=UPI00369DE137
MAVIEGDELHLVLPDDLSQIGTTTPVIDSAPDDNGDAFGSSISTVRPLLPPLINSTVVIVASCRSTTTTPTWSPSSRCAALARRPR